MQVKSDRDYIKSLQNTQNEERELLDYMDENIINPELPKSSAIEDMPPIVEKVYYKIPKEYKELNKKEKHSFKYKK